MISLSLNLAYMDSRPVWSWVVSRPPRNLQRKSPKSRGQFQQNVSKIQFSLCLISLAFIVSIMEFKVEECNEPSCEALIFPYGVVLFNIFSTMCI